jgi:acyl-CoA thioesterase FadM
MLNQTGSYRFKLQIDFNEPLVAHNMLRLLLEINEIRNVSLLITKSITNFRPKLGHNCFVVESFVLLCVYWIEKNSCS